MENFVLKKIGVVQLDQDGFSIQLEEQYRPALRSLDGFSHLNVLWWFSGCDTLSDRATIVERSPYKKRRLKWVCLPPALPSVQIPSA